MTKDFKYLENIKGEKNELYVVGTGNVVYSNNQIVSVSF